MLGNLHSLHQINRNIAYLGRHSHQLWRTEVLHAGTQRAAGPGDKTGRFRSYTGSLLHNQRVCTSIGQIQRGS